MPSTLARADGPCPAARGVPTLSAVSFVSRSQVLSQQEALPAEQEAAAEAIPLTSPVCWKRFGKEPSTHSPCTSLAHPGLGEAPLKPLISAGPGNGSSAQVCLGGDGAWQLQGHRKAMEPWNPGCFLPRAIKPPSTEPLFCPRLPQFHRE